MKTLLLFIIASSSFANTISQNLSQKSWRPQSLKKLKIDFNNYRESNFLNVSKGEALSLAAPLPENFQGYSAYTTNIKLSAEFLFKPTKKYILINNFNLDEKASQVQGDDSFGILRHSIQNNLIGVYLINKTQLIGHSTKVGYVAAPEYQLNTETNSIEELEGNYVEVSAATFYQYKFTKQVSSRVTFNAQLLEYDSNYSSFSAADGEQDDQLNLKARIDNKFKMTKNIILNLPLAFKRQYYKNRIALASNGAFLEDSQEKPRDTLQSTEVGPEVLLRFPWAKISLTAAQINQKDLNFGARDFRGHREKINVEFPFSQSKLTTYYSNADLKYRQALNIDSSNWRERTIQYGLEYTLPSLISEGLDLNLKHQKELARDNFFGGKFDNELYQVGLSYRL